MKTWDMTIEDTGTGKTRMYNRYGKKIPRTAYNIKNRRVRVWNSIQADFIREKGGIPVRISEAIT